MDLAMSTPITSFPDEIIIDIIARVPRSTHPSLSLVSKRFRSLVASPVLYKRRSLLACTEHCLYVALYNHETHENRLYILHKNRLVLISSLPALHIDGSFVVKGSKIYARSLRVYGMEMSPSKVLSVDCWSHTVTWEGSDEMLDWEKWKYGCVIDEVVYFYDCGKKKFKAFDTKKMRCWMDVQGVEGLVTGSLSSAVYTVNHGGKLAVIVRRQSGQSKEIWCAEIAIEKREGGEIWGEVEWCGIVIEGNFHIHDYVSVVV